MTIAVADPSLLIAGQESRWRTAGTQTSPRHPRHQLGRREGLDDVVGRTRLARPRDGLVVPVGRDEYDRPAGSGTVRISSMLSVPGGIRSSSTRAGCSVWTIPRELAVVAGHQRGVARLGQRVAHMGQGLGVVVDREDAPTLAPRLRRKRPAKGVIDVRRGTTLGVSLGPRRRGRDGSAAGLRRRRGIAPWAVR